MAALHEFLSYQNLFPCTSDYDICICLDVLPVCLAYKDQLPFFSILVFMTIYFNKQKMDVNKTVPFFYLDGMVVDLYALSCLKSQFLVLQLPTEALLSHVLEAPGLHEWLEGASEVGNPDALLLALRIQEKVSVDSKKLGKLLPTPFSSSKLFAADHLSSLVNCLKVIIRYAHALQL